MGLSQTKLAILTGCLTPGQISDYERGTRYPHPKARRQIAHVLQCSEADLFGEGVL
jgi:transcriptional regulator with XRE-family HTH domain